MQATTFKRYEFFSGRHLSIAVGDEIRYSSEGIVTSQYRCPVIAVVLELGDHWVKVQMKDDQNTGDYFTPSTIGVERIEAIFPKFK